MAEIKTYPFRQSPARRADGARPALPQGPLASRRAAVSPSGSPRPHGRGRGPARGSGASVPVPRAQRATSRTLIVQGVVTFRFADPGADRPPGRLHASTCASGQLDRDAARAGQADCSCQMAQQYVIDELDGDRLRTILRRWRGAVRERDQPGGSAAGRRSPILASRSSLSAWPRSPPTATCERALQQPTRSDPAAGRRGDVRPAGAGGREGARDPGERAAEQDRARAARGAAGRPARAPTSAAGPRSRPPRARSRPRRPTRPSASPPGAGPTRSGSWRRPARGRTDAGRDRERPRRRSPARRSRRASWPRSSARSSTSRSRRS